MDKWNLAFAIIAAIAAVVAVIIAVWGILLQKSRYRFEDDSNLAVRISPTRQGAEQLAAFRVHNDGRRPIYISGWYYTLPDGSGNDSTGSVPFAIITTTTFPFFLEEQDAKQIVVSLQDVEWEKVTDIGIIDIKHRRYPVSEEEWKIFVETAKHYHDIPSPFDEIPPGRGPLFTAPPGE